MGPLRARRPGPVSYDDDDRRNAPLRRRPGWCVLQSRFLIGGMAAVPEAGGTRFAFLGGLRLPGMRLLDPVLRPAVRKLALRPIRRLEQRLWAADRMAPGRPGSR